MIGVSGRNGDMDAQPGLILRTEPTPDDVDWIVERHGAFHCRELGFDKSFEDYVANPLREALDGARPRDGVWIAERDGERVGCIAIIENDFGEAQLRWFLVEPEARRVGIGSLLLDTALGFAREHGYGRMVLWTVRELRDAARLYQRAGFRRTLIRPGHEWGVDVIEERYDLELGDPVGALDRREMEVVARGWGRVADEYVEALFDELDGKPFDRELLERFAERAGAGTVVGDVGCGPGHVSKFLAARGLRMQGIDLCPEMVSKARELVPEAEFRVGNMLELDLPDSAWGGAIAFYSLINLVRDDAPVALAEIARVMCDGAPLAIAVHRGSDVLRADNVFGHVAMAATLYEPDELAALVEASGFSGVEVQCRKPNESEFPSERVYVIARRSI